MLKYTPIENNPTLFDEQFKKEIIAAHELIFGTVGTPIISVLLFNLGSYDTTSLDANQRTGEY